MDRNVAISYLLSVVVWSLSARRAWIEMEELLQELSSLFVALRKESVDRNKIKDNRKPPPRQSLSARRAWIEI